MNDRIRILYTEDDPADAALTRRRFALDAPECDLDIVTSGRACLDRLAQHDYDLLLLDYCLPDMDGLEVARTLMRQGVSLPVVLITGAGNEDLVVQAVRLGVTDYITKRGDYLAALPQTLRRIAEAHRKEGAIGRSLVPSRPRILYVEHHASDIELLLRHFGQAAPHLTVHLAYSCWNALDLLREAQDLREAAPYDLVLADLRMPDMSGLDLLREAKDRGMSLPFVIVTGQGDEEVAVAALRLGAYDYIVKRDGYLTQLPHVIDNAIARFHLYQAAGRLQAELEMLNRSLEHRVQERTAALEREIGERKQTEAALHESECRYREFITHLPVAAYATDITGGITLYNDAAIALWGRRPDPSDRWWGGTSTLHTPDGAILTHAQCPMAVAAREIRSFYNFEVMTERADGTRVNIVANITPMIDTSGRVLGATNVMLDITERKQTEDALLARARQQAAVAEVGSFALSDANTDQVLNKAVAMIAGTLDVELCKVLELLPDRSALRLRAGVGWHTGLVGQATVPTDRYSQAGYTLFVNEPVIVRDLRTETRFQGPSLLIDHGVTSGLSVQITGPEGPYGVLGAHTTSLRTFTADDVHFLQTMANILANAVARKQAETSLAESERVRRRILESVQEGIHGLDSTGHIMFENPASFKMFGWKRQNVIGQHAHTLMHHHRADGSAYPVEECLIYRTLHDGQTRHVDNEVFFRPDGTSFPVEYTASALRDDAGVITGVVVSFRDVTEFKQLQEQFLQSQKLEAIGALAGGIAHDFNNNLSAILGFSDLALDHLHPEDPIYRYLTQVKKAGEQSASLTRQLLAFSRKQLLQPKVLDLNVLISELQIMLQRMIGENIQLRLLLHPELGRVKADPGQVEQVIMNLVVNARDAMPDGGTLTLQTGNVECDEAEVGARPPMIAGPYIRLAVSDTGCGMDATTQARIFEPFFTTKELGKGTGLGLSTVYGIVKQSAGYIWVDSTPGQGTTFTIDLPRVEAPLDAASAIEVSMSLRRSVATILLVDDDEMVRTVARETLQAQGHTVLEALNAGGAILIAERHQGAIDLLLTDVVMPYMSGPELAQRLTAQRPETKVLYMSGYTDDALSPHGVLQPGIGFLTKPFTSDGLLRAVQEALGVSGHSAAGGA